MACVPIDDRHHPHENAIISFNTIGNNSISHHVPIPGHPPPPSTPRCTSGRTPLRKRTPKLVVPPKSAAKKEDHFSPTIDGYTIHPDDDDVKTSARRVSCMECVSNVGNWYAAQLESHPVRTKSLTAGTLAVIGDVLAQIIEFGTALKDKDILFDNRRIFAMFIEGSCVSGPMLHFVFEFYEYICPIHCIDECVHKDQDLKSTGSFCDEEDGEPKTTSPPEQTYTVSKRQYLAAFLHVAFDQVVMAFPYVAGMMIVTALVEGHGSNLAEELEDEYMNNVKASWMAALLLAPYQFLAFRYLPITWRVLAVNLQDVIWVMAMSYVTHRTRETSEPFFDFATDDFNLDDHDDIFSVHDYNATADAGEY
ncbi:hypothetical protein ACHAWX_002377 [Stephanocyclus meneghinianus]